MRNATAFDTNAFSYVNRHIVFPFRIASTFIPSASLSHLFQIVRASTNAPWITAASFQAHTHRSELSSPFRHFRCASTVFVPWLSVIRRRQSAHEVEPKPSSRLHALVDKSMCMYAPSRLWAHMHARTLRTRTMFAPTQLWTHPVSSPCEG